jgi:hypothetical protein
MVAAILSVVCSAEENQLVKTRHPIPTMDISIADMNTIITVFLIEMFFLHLVAPSFCDGQLLHVMQAAAFKFSWFS